MRKLVKGLHKFQSEIFPFQKDVFEGLMKGQNPDALFITCSDSRIDPNLIFQAKPGELFVLRNAGNIVPKFEHLSAEAATIEFAVNGLGIEDVIICGHTHCGAVKGLLNKDNLKEMPALSQWLTHADECREIVNKNYKDLAGDDLINVAVQENVLVQLENLKTHPAIAKKLSEGKLTLHAWVYKFETGEIFAYSTEEGQFLPVNDLSKHTGVNEKADADRRLERLASRSLI